MPLYVYHCKKCNALVEVLQHYDDDALAACPKCGQPVSEKIFTPIPIHFKGNGWYVKDRYNPDKAV